LEPLIADKLRIEEKRSRNNTASIEDQVAILHTSVSAGKFWSKLLF
jgi:hypothetical protein